MKFSDFAHRIFKYLKIRHKKSFIIELFKVAGSSYDFDETHLNSKSNYSNKLFTGNKPLSNPIKRTFGNPINIQATAEFFIRNIEDAHLSEIATSFQIATHEKYDITCLSYALAEQLNEIINGNERCIIDQSYYNCLNAPNYTTKNSSLKTVLYKGDSMYVTGNTTYSVNFYELFTHTWNIQNSGEVSWNNRYLICTNETNISPKVSINKIALPPIVEPGQHVTLSVQFDSRGREGEYRSEWTMMNEQNKKCFEFTGTLTVSIKVENKDFKNK